MRETSCPRPLPWYVLARGLHHRREPRRRRRAAARREGWNDGFDRRIEGPPDLRAAARRRRGALRRGGAVAPPLGLRLPAPAAPDDALRALAPGVLRRGAGVRRRPAAPRPARRRRRAG